MLCRARAARRGDGGHAQGGSRGYRAHCLGCRVRGRAQRRRPHADPVCGGRARGALANVQRGAPAARVPGTSPGLISASTKQVSFWQVRRLRALREESERRLRSAEAAAAPVSNPNPNINPIPGPDAPQQRGVRHRGGAAAADPAGAAAAAAATAAAASQSPTQRGRAPTLPQKRAAGSDAAADSAGGAPAREPRQAAAAGAAAAAAAAGAGRGGDGAADLAAVTAVGAESGLDNPEPLLVAGMRRTPKNCCLTSDTVEVRHSYAAM